MTVALPRLLGAVAVLLGVWLLVDPPSGWPTAWQGIGMPQVMAAGWLAACGLLVVGRGVRLAAWTLAVLAPLPVLATDSYGSPFSLVFWLSIIVAVTEGRSGERALLVRACVTTVYAFTALAKLNPSFLGGDQLVHVATSRDHMAAFGTVFASNWGIALSFVALGIEAWLAVGLWFSRTRVGTAMLGALAHAVFVVIATSSPAGLLYLVPLNALLVIGYLAFFCPLPPRRPTDELSAICS